MMNKHDVKFYISSDLQNSFPPGGGGLKIYTRVIFYKNLQLKCKTKIISKEARKGMDIQHLFRKFKYSNDF